MCDDEDDPEENRSHLPNFIHSVIQKLKRILNPYDKTGLISDEVVDGKTIFLRNMLTGGVAASIAVTVMAPMERIKLILQVQNSITSKPGRTVYKGLLDALVRIPREQGVKALWRGNTASIVRGFPYQALNFAFRDKYRNYFARGYDKKREFWSRFRGNLLSGGVAGATSMAILYPLDYARTRMAMDFGNSKKTRETKNIGTVIIDAYKRDGYRGLYRGFWFSLIGVFIYRATYFGLFDTAKDAAPEELRHTLAFAFASAEISATFSGFLAYPFDTVRRSMMMQSGKSAPEKRYNSSMDCMKKIYKGRGIKGFYFGSLTNVIRGTGGAMMLVLYDELQLELWTHHHQRHHGTLIHKSIHENHRPYQYFGEKARQLTVCPKDQDICPVRKFAERINLICDI